MANDRIYEIFTPEIKANVRYRVVMPTETDAFVIKHREESPEDFTRKVLEVYIANLKTEVSEALKRLSKPKGRAALDSLFRACVMLNPGLDIDNWLKLSNNSNTIDASDKKVSNALVSVNSGAASITAKKRGRLSRVKVQELDIHLKSKIIGQEEAVETLVSCLKRAFVGLADENRPMGVFLFAGASGVGKTHLARELHKFLFPDSTMVRIDCGEYQHKHENQKLIGSPPGYIGSDEGGQLTSMLAKNPATVVLIDEVEKAHPDLWNTFLHAFDEGYITDSKGETFSLKDTIVIMTSNLSNEEVVDYIQSKGVGFGNRVAKTPSRSYVEEQANKAIRKYFRPEFLNRITKIVIFNHLTDEDFRRIAAMELNVVDEKLGKKGFHLMFDESALDGLMKGAGPVGGVRGLSKIREEYIETKLADVLLKGRFARGTVFQLLWDNGFTIETVRKRAQAVGKEVEK